MVHSQALPPPVTFRMQRPWAFWLLFFFQFAAIGIFFTYLNIYYRNAGLTGTQIGLINMVAALVGAAGSVGWGYLADRTGKARYFIAGGAIVAVLIIQVVPYVHTFWLFLGLTIFSSLANSAPGTLVDSTTLSMLGDHREDYGRYRLGGSIGYVVATFFSGFFYDQFGLALMFPIFGVIMTAFAGIALLLPATPVRVEQNQRAKGGIGVLIRTPSWILLTVVIFLIWIAANASILFLGVTLDAMGASQGLIGVSITIGAIVEIPIMIYSAYLMRRFGPVRLLTVAMILMIVRYFLLGLMPVPEWSVPINMLNGLAFPFYWNSAITLANKMAPPGYAGTAQGLFNSTMSLAGLASAPLTGWLFDLMGANRLFIVMAFSCMAALLLFVVGNLAKKTRMEYN